MRIQKIVSRVIAISLGMVNVFLVDGDDGLTLIDTGTPGSAGKILEAVREYGRQPEDIKHILLTHLHVDHTGSIRALQRFTGAQVYMHPLDAALVRQGIAMRPFKPGPGFTSRLAVSMIARSGSNGQIEPAEADHTLDGGEILPFAAGLKVIFTPGHTAGHLCFLWPNDGGVLIAGDACGNIIRLSTSIIYEDLALGLQSLSNLGRLDFATAVFSHGRPLRNAGAAFRNKWKA